MISRLISFRRAALFGALLAAPLAVHAQTAADALRFAEQTPAIGPRAIGLAGAATAGLADPTALFTNPAGLGFYRSSEVSGALGFSNVRDDVRYSVGGETTPFDASLQGTRLDHATYVYKVPTVRGSLVFGAAYQQTNLFDRDLSFRATTNQSSISASYLPYDDEFEADEEGVSFYNDVPLIAYNAGLIEYLPENLDNGGPLFYEAVNPGTTIEQRGQVLEGGVMQEVSFGGAVEGARDVMFGLSANLSFGRYDFERRFEETDINDENGLTDYEVILSNRTLRGFDRATVRDYLRSDLFGINLRGGVAARVSSLPLRAGLSVETPTYYVINEDYSTEIETFFDEGGSLQYGGQIDDAGTGTFEYQLITPWRISAGLAYVGTPLTVSVDFETIDWQEMRFDSDEFVDDVLRDQNEVMRSSLRRVLNSRVGAEYTFGNVALRAGYAYQPDPRRQDDVFGQSDGVDRSRTTFALGAGIEVARGTSIDFGWMRTTFDDVYAPYGDVAVVPVADESITRDRFSLGLRVAL